MPLDQNFPEGPAQEITCQSSDENGDDQTTKKCDARQVGHGVPAQGFRKELIFEQNKGGDPQAQAEDDDEKG